MANKPQYYVYWDSCVFTSLLNEYADRAPIIKGMWEEVVVKRHGKIVTSALSIVEVAHLAIEKDRQRRYTTVDDDLNKMWRDNSLLVVEAPRHLMEKARELMRASLPSGGGLKGADAIHLATAKFMEANGIVIQEINTYDADWQKYAPLVGITICEPHFDPKSEQTSYLQGEGEAAEADDFEE